MKLRTTKPLLSLLVLISALISSVAADQSVTIAWDPSISPDVSSYTIWYGTSSRVYTLSTNVGNVTTATVYGLQEGTTWYFALTATSTSGLDSDFSIEITNAIPIESAENTPTISPLPDIKIRQNGDTNIPFTVWDVETFPGDLMVAASSTNQALIPISGLTVTGTNWNRFLHIVPNPLASGVTLITLVVSDGMKASSTSFLVNVVPIPMAPTQLNFIAKMQVSDSPNGPWQNIVTTILPVDMSGSSNKYYRTWLDVGR